MKTARNCIVCGSDNLLKYPAEIAPFVRSRMEINQESQREHVKFCLCIGCVTAFYDARPEEGEMSKLYSDYRGVTYCEQRERFEPGYSHVNQLIGNNGTEIKVRKENLDELLDHYFRYHKPIEELQVLDWGGDRGQFIPDLFRNSSRHVYEISGVAPLEGIKLISEPAANSYDFVLCNHTLEHVSDPMNLLREINLALVDGGYLYLEVPFDLPKRPLLKLLAPALPIQFSVVPMHEHINFFTSTSMAALCRNAGFQLVHIRNKLLDFGWVKINCLSLLALKNSHQNQNWKSRFSRLQDLGVVVNAIVRRRLEKFRCERK